MPTVLVTGATGLVGNNVVRALLARGDSVKVLIREGSDPRPLAGLPVERRFGDIRHLGDVRGACEGVSVVVHAAAMVAIGGRHLERFRAINVGGTRNIVNAAKETGARLVHVSTADTIGGGTVDSPADENATFNPRFATAYSISKAEAESLVVREADRGLDAVIVNPSYMFGPYDWKPSSGRMLLEVGRGFGVFPPRGHGNFVDVRDVADAILRAADGGRAGRRYLLTGEILSFLDVWRLIARVTGKFPPVWRIGPVVSLLSGWTGDCIGLLSGREPVVNSAALRSARAPACYSSRRAERELGFKRRTLDESIRQAWTWFVENGYARGRSEPPGSR